MPSGSLTDYVPLCTILYVVALARDIGQMPQVRARMCGRCPKASTGGCPTAWVQPAGLPAWRAGAHLGPGRERARARAGERAPASGRRRQASAQRGNAQASARLSAETAPGHGPETHPAGRKDPPAGTPTPPGGQGGALQQEGSKTVRNCGAIDRGGVGRMPGVVDRPGVEPGSTLLRPEPVAGV
jgi:hypothetical protein